MEITRGRCSQQTIDLIVQSKTFRKSTTWFSDTSYNVSRPVYIVIELISLLVLAIYASNCGIIMGSLSLILSGGLKLA
jgi:hypothetical protein